MARILLAIPGPVELVTMTTALFKRPGKAQFSPHPSMALGHQAASHISASMAAPDTSGGETTSKKTEDRSHIREPEQNLQGQHRQQPQPLQEPGSRYRRHQVPRRYRSETGIRRRTWHIGGVKVSKQSFGEMTVLFDRLHTPSSNFA